ncbi:MAG TPA: TetR/AcrR family transcriptional regulator [Vicinamibacterales bacterium]|nr:TetR/AcrR family transcriptional regulator [Vicinamibacterales bacterium]
MARPREFSVDEALDGAIAEFRRAGFGGASLDALTDTMGIGRGSLYGAFGDKRALFLAALARYAEATAGQLVARLDTAANPLGAVRETLRMVARRATEREGRFGCLITNTLAELGTADAGVTAVVDDALGRIAAAYERALGRARARGALPRSSRPKTLARFLVLTMQGLRIMGRSGASRRELLAMADTAFGALGAPGGSR